MNKIILYIYFSSHFIHFSYCPKLWFTFYKKHAIGYLNEAAIVNKG